jgi:hypothetical protein
VAERALKLAGVQLPSTPRARELVFSVVVPDRDDAIKTAELLSAQLGFYCAGVEYVESDTDAATIPLYNRVPGSTDPASAAGSGPADGGDPAAD